MRKVQDTCAFDDVITCPHHTSRGTQGARRTQYMLLMCGVMEEERCRGCRRCASVAPAAPEKTVDKPETRAAAAMEDQLSCHNAICKNHALVEERKEEITT